MQIKHWIPEMLRHDLALSKAEQAPTGDDYNAIFPAGLGLIWHICDDIGEFYSHCMAITAHHGAIIHVVENDEDDAIHVIFAITREGYAAMLGHEPDETEWLSLKELAPA